MKNKLEQYLKLSEALVTVGEAHLKAHEEFTKFQDTISVEEFEEMVKPGTEEYKKLQDLEARYSKVEGAL